MGLGLRSGSPEAQGFDAGVMEAADESRRFELDQELSGKDAATQAVIILRHIYLES